LTPLIAEAKAKIEAGDLEGGVDAFQRIAVANPEIPEVFNNLGAICAAMGRTEQAETAFDRAVQLSPDNANPLYNRGLMRFQSGNYLGARDDFQAALDRSPQDPELCNNVGVCNYLLKDWPAARHAFERATELRPDYLAAHLNLIDVDLAESLNDQALARAKSVADEHPGPEASVKLVECRIQVAARALDLAAEAAENSLRHLDDQEIMRAQLGQIAAAKQTLVANPAYQPKTEPDRAVAAAQ
jgi:Flp pilus assembly protein TadD